MNTNTTLAAALISLAALASGPAKALTVYTLNQSSALGNTSFGTVSLSQNGANAVDVSVLLNAGYRFVETGGPHDAFTFNLPGLSGYTVSNISAVQDLTPTVRTAHAYSWVSSGSNPGYGSFTDKLQCGSCGMGGSNAFANALSFKLNKTGILESSFQANTSGFVFSADLLRLSDGVTGAVAVSAVPEAQTSAFMLLGLLGLSFMARRRRQN